MNDRLKDMFYEDNGDFVSGYSNLFKEWIYVTYSDSNLVLKYDFSANPGEEFVSIKAIHQCDMNAITVPESELTHLYVQLGPAATESAIDSIKNEIKPLIEQFKKAYDQYQSEGPTMDFVELGQKYSEVSEEITAIVEDSDLGWDGMRAKGETAADVYWADPEILDATITPDMSDEEIKLAAIEDTFWNGVLFHPDEIASVMSIYRDDLIDQAS
jgi:hypothetical protein